MICTTLCYIEKEEDWLMLHRVKKKNDLNHDKWIGVGGKFEEEETPEECLLREVSEETGLTLTDYTLRGIITFLSDRYEGEYMFLYTAKGWTGTLKECNEGELVWVSRSEVPGLPTWEGDRYFLKELMEGSGFFTMKLRYEGEKLAEMAVKHY